VTVREELHVLIDALPEHELSTVRRFLLSVTPPLDKLGAFLAAAPEDDEPSTVEQDAAAAEAREALRRGERVSADEVKRSLLP